MSSNDVRIRMIQDALREHRLDAIVCALPANVLMLSGYWPVVGTAIDQEELQVKRRCFLPTQACERALDVCRFIQHGHDDGNEWMGQSLTVGRVMQSPTASTPR